MTPGNPAPRIPAVYRDRLRVRVGALVVQDNALLLVEHEGLWEAGPFWTPPGGGVDYGEALPEALRREVQEETGVDLEVGALRYVLDFVRPPLHAVSFYFECTVADATALRLGTDPELDTQLLRSVCWQPLDALSALTLYPEPFRERLATDARAGFPGGTLYLGTFR